MVFHRRAEATDLARATDTDSTRGVNNTRCYTAKLIRTLDGPREPVASLCHRLKALTNPKKKKGSTLSFLMACDLEGVGGAGGGGGSHIVGEAEEGSASSFIFALVRLSDYGWPEAVALRYLSKDLANCTQFWDGLVQACCAGMGTDNRTSLMYHAYRGNESRVEWLLARGAEPDGVITSGGGCAALHFAAQEGNAGVCRLLLKHGADVEKRSKNGTSVLHYG